MKRLIEQDLIEWKNKPDRKPLVIFGARQIGKTYSLLEFGKAHYSNTVYCNFEASSSTLNAVFGPDLDTKRIISTLSALYGTEIREGETLIILDEIQASEKALASLKYFNEENNAYHIVAAGSLLGLAFNREQYSFPVGKVDILNMYPLSFEEFLMATGNEKLLPLIRDSYESFSPFPLHEKALDLYRQYLAIGGYPAAIRAYLEKGDYNAVRSEQTLISAAYIADMAKYSPPADLPRCIETYESIVSQLSKENGKFQYSVIKSGARAKDYENALLLLKRAGVILSSQRISEGHYPISLNEDLSSFKAYYCDVGLLTMRIALTAKSILSPINISPKAKGLLAESYVAQELASKGFKLRYWTSGNASEVDFVIQIGEEVIPIEVKSADNVKSKSLNVFVKNYRPSYSLRISSRNFGYENGIKSVPIYALFCLPKNLIEE